MTRKSIGIRPKGNMKYLGGLSTLFSFSEVLQRDPRNVYVNTRKMSSFKQPDSSPVTDYEQTIGYVTNLINGQLAPLVNPITYLPTPAALIANFGTVQVEANTPIHIFIDNHEGTTYYLNTVTEAVDLPFQLELVQNMRVIYLFGKYKPREIEQVKNILALDQGYEVPTFSPRHLFLNSEQGIWLDPSDLSTMYQDAAGTIPVTGVGQPVGLMLDKSKGLIIGNNVSLVSTASKDTDDVQYLNLISNTSYAFKWFDVEFTIHSLSTPVSIFIEGISGGTLLYFTNLSLGINKIKIMTGSTGVIRLGAVSSSRYNLSDITVKEVAGKHAYQKTSASRPILQQSPILAPNLLPTYDFSTWRATGAPNPLTANSFTTATSGGVQSALLKPNTSYVIELDIENTSTVNVYHGASKNTLVTSGTRRKVLIQTATDNGTAFYFRNATAGTTTVHSIKVQEITGYRTDQTYLEFDGIDDFLTIDLPEIVTDSVFFAAKVRRLRLDKTYEYIFSNSADTGAGRFSARLTSAPNLETAAAGVGIDVATDQYASVVSSVKSNELSLVVGVSRPNKIGLYTDNTISERVPPNTVLPTKILSPIVIGKANPLANSWAANMRISELIVVFDAVSDDEIPKIVEYLRS